MLRKHHITTKSNRCWADGMPKKEEQQELIGELRHIMKEAIEELGGAAEAAEKLRARGVIPMQLVIEMMGGKEKVADKLGISRTTFYAWLNEPYGTWPHGVLDKLEDETKIPMKVLTSVPMPGMPAKVELSKLRRKRSKPNDNKPAPNGR